MDANDSLYHNFDGFINKNNKGSNSTNESQGKHKVITK